MLRTRFVPALALGPVPCLVLCALLAGACGDDAGDDDDDDAVGVDGGTEPLMSPMFGPCASDADCAEVGTEPTAFCRTSADGFPVGSCSRTCTLAGCRDDELNHECLSDEDERIAFADAETGLGRTCYRYCALSTECGAGEACIDGACIPWSCGADGVCAGGVECGPNGRCGGRGNPGGAADGTACTAGSACASGICYFGQCASNCELPTGYNSIEFFTPQPGAPRTLPAGACDTDDVCFPLLDFLGGSYAGTAPNFFLIFGGGAVGRKDPGRCWQGCTSNAECPDGTFCLNKVQVGNDAADTFEFQRGACFPAPRM